MNKPELKKHILPKHIDDYPVGPSTMPVISLLKIQDGEASGRLLIPNNVQAVGNAICVVPKESFLKKEK